MALPKLFKYLKSNPTEPKQPNNFYMAHFFSFRCSVKPAVNY